MTLAKRGHTFWQASQIWECLQRYEKGRNLKLQLKI